MLYICFFQSIFMLFKTIFIIVIHKLDTVNTECGFRNQLKYKDFSHNQCVISRTQYLDNGDIMDVGESYFKY